MKILTIIAARRDSKGIPGKNWKMLGKKPLIAWTIETALETVDPGDICISTNSDEIIRIAEVYGIKVPFVRPEELCTDTATSREAVLHALDFYNQNNPAAYDTVMQLQPTSPFRKKEHLQGCIDLYAAQKPDMVISAYVPNLNPYYNMYSEDQNGFIRRAIPSPYTRRQDCPTVYALNGSIYVISAEAIRQKEIHEFERVIKYVMPSAFAIDLDSPEDWDLAEFLISKNRFS
jgi:N-acylneuraminate cytidylyltransferase